MAGAAAQMLKEVLAMLRRACGGQRGVAGRDGCGADELSKMIDIGEAQCVRNIFRIGCRFADGSHILGAKAAGDAHLVQVGIARKRQQASVLILPAKAPHAGLSRRLEDGCIYDFAVNLSFAQARLVCGDCNQRLIVDGFHEAVAEWVEHGAEGTDVFGGRDVFLGFRAYWAIVYDGTACDGVLTVVDEDGGIDKVAIGAGVAYAQFCNLACAAGVGVFVAGHARGAVVDRSESGLAWIVALGLMIPLKYLLIQGEGVARRLVVAIAYAGRAVEAGSVEAGRSLSF